MKKTKLTYVVILFLITVGIVGCKVEKPYNLYWDNNNLVILIPQPTKGISGVNEENWNGIARSDLSKDIYEEIINSSQVGNVDLYVRFENKTTDKYGNTSGEYRDVFIVSLPISEVNKYVSGEYLDIEYGIWDKIHAAGMFQNEFLGNDNMKFVQEETITDQEWKKEADAFNALN